MNESLAPFHLSNVGKANDKMLLFSPQAARTRLPGIADLYSTIRNEGFWNYQGAPNARTREQIIELLSSFYGPCAQLLNRGGIISTLGQFCRAEAVGVPFLNSRVYPLGQTREKCKVTTVPDDKIFSDVFELGFLPYDLQPSREVNPLLSSSVRKLEYRRDLNVEGVDKGASLVFVAPSFSATLDYIITLGGGVIWRSVPTLTNEDLFIFDLEKALETRFKRLFDKAKLPRIVGHTATAIGVFLADCKRSVQ